ncbi:unnamed protein product [Caenorhabditis bovis]|uniref:separase n=1 Tax=Caenorhabditis bovis TaxID=2654633 RepID=A0A8S1F028_9PELO|nr:unnamed protein product [Caenorhabditis bovis]
MRAVSRMLITYLDDLTEIQNEHYKAIVCLCQYAQLVPEDVIVKENILKWLTFLGENELTFAKIKEFKMDSLSPLYTDIVNLFLSYMKSREHRVERLEKMKHLYEKIKEIGLKKKSFGTFDLLSFSSWMMSLLSNVPIHSNMEKSEFPERSNYLLDASIKADSLVRNRLPGLSPYSFENTANASVFDYLENSKNPVSPTEYICLGSSIAWMFEIRKELAFFYTSIAQSREAMSAFVLNWRVALRSASLQRILQAANGAFYYYKVIDEPESKSYLKTINATCVNLLSPEAVVVRCSTPIMQDENDEYTIRKTVSSRKANIRRIAGDDETLTMHEITEEMNDLKIEEECILHRVSKTCRCTTCTHYYNMSSFSIEYQFSKALNSDFSQDSIVEIDKQYVDIRLEMMKVQRLLFKEAVKPRPGIALNEIFAMCVIRWISNKIARREEFDETSVQILKNAMKASRYVPLRTLEHSLILNQLHRKYRNPLPCRLSWMQPVERKPFVKIGIECAVDILRAVSPFGRKPKLARERISEAEKLKEIEVAYQVHQEIRTENALHSHLLYREWRASAFPYAARICQDPWESAYAWAEATAVGSRGALQNKIGICRRDCVTISGAMKLKTFVRAMPEEMTIVQIARCDDGHVYLIKMHCDRDPIVMPIAHATQATELMDKFTHLLQEDERIARDPGDRTPEQFWNTRKAIDARVKSLVEEAEKNFLDVAAYLLRPSIRVGEKTLRNAARIEKQLNAKIRLGEAKELVFLSSKMEERAWIKLMLRYSELRNVVSLTETTLSAYYRRFRDDVDLDGVPNPGKMYTYLVICPDLSQFCWENLPIFASHPFVCRMVSIHAMINHFESLSLNKKQVPLHVDLDKSYYVLDPDNNLGQTKKRMLEFINKFKWEGTVGAAPKPNEVVSALENMDAFFYFGHGSGSKHVHRNTVKHSKCNAISLLMGCGSVRTLPQGVGWDGKSVLLDYVLAKCPLVVGCLWTITDGEIDRYLMRMVDDCFENNGGFARQERNLKQLSEAMESARSKAKLKYLTGASVVMYGFPIIAKPGDSESAAKMSAISEKMLKSVYENQIFADCVTSRPIVSRIAAQTPTNDIVKTRGIQVFENIDEPTTPTRTRMRATRNL